MRTIEVAARTVDEAVAEALEKLQVQLDEVEVTVLDEGSKGFLGLLGSKMARVVVSTKPPIEGVKLEAALEFVKELLEKMGFAADVAGTVEDGSIKLEISGDDLGLLIGRRGQTLDSLQYITTLAVNRQGGEWVRILLDIGEYRAKREETIRYLARKSAEKASLTGRRVPLEPMNAAERRIVHQAVQEFDGVETESEGQDPHRRVVVLPK
ncbi:MAG TPA: protein jag [Firmicutes bacterium]|nr:protein jag [Bacillota bacterium]